MSRRKRTDRLVALAAVFVLVASMAAVWAVADARADLESPTVADDPAAAVADRQVAAVADRQAPADYDGDGLADDADACPTRAETQNGFRDGDGCPDAVATTRAS
ncbi:hypothetical protein [Haloferax massiliensis]|uniref:Thrombospondin type 3 repeat protein n=1 Tax=Haloferax massiliensis TaxID=1476858 RepID=A0A0D6JWS7_9EURY|nr:hypothetical protein [Haloferax massiliensis]CQR53252.1 hypothetical protein BN996_03541 [Haloferax massiliensis]